MEMIRFGSRIGVNSCLSLIVLGVAFVSQIWGNEWYSGVTEVSKVSKFTKLLMCMGFRRESSRGGGIMAMGRCQ